MAVRKKTTSSRPPSAGAAPSGTSKRVASKRTAKAASTKKIAVRKPTKTAAATRATEPTANEKSGGSPAVPARTVRTRPRYLDAYLVEDNSGGPPVGVARRTGNVWRSLRFGVSRDEQPAEVFETRAEAGARLLELARTEE
jgi:hypothetical protein